MMLMISFARGRPGIQSPSREAGMFNCSVGFPLDAVKLQSCWPYRFRVCHPSCHHDIYLGKFHHDLTATSLTGIMVTKGNHPQMALIQVSVIL